jgi:hypothetical protein
MAMPQKDMQRRGALSASGKYFWRAYSNGSDRVQLERAGREAEVTFIPQKKIDYQQLQGSNEFYSYTADHFWLPQIKAQFVSCYCPAHRSGAPEDCPYAGIVYSNIKPKDGSPAWTGPEVFTVHRLNHKRSRVDDSSDDAEYGAPPSRCTRSRGSSIQAAGVR